MLPSSSKDFSVSIRPLFSDGKDIRVLTHVSFRFLDDNLVYRGDGTDDGRAFVTPGDTARDTITVTVRDTVYINEGGPSTQLLGDLNNDGVVNVADFLLFVANFGKTQSVSEQPEHPPVKKYSSCAEMRADWPKGVNKNGGTYSEAWNDAEKRTYEMRKTHAVFKDV